MLDILVRLVINAVALVAAVRLVPGAAFSGEWWQLALVAAIFGLVNAYLRPIVRLLSLPLTLLTFGAVGFVINTGMVLIVAAVSDQLDLGFTLAGWPPGAIDAEVIITALLVSIVVSIVSTMVALLRLVVPRL